MATNGKVFMFLGEGTHKIKKKAEQIACERAIASLQKMTV
jgi:dsRNA-specific ribonuclease